MLLPLIFFLLQIRIRFVPPAWHCYNWIKLPIPWQWLRLPLLASPFQYLSHVLTLNWSNQTRFSIRIGNNTSRPGKIRLGCVIKCFQDILHCSTRFGFPLSCPCLTKQGLYFRGTTVSLLWNYLRLSRCVSAPVSKISSCFASPSSSNQLRVCALDGQTVMCSFN